MSDIEQSDLPAEAEGGSTKVETHPLGRIDLNDWFLGTLVNWANKFNAEIGVTLSVGGALISGVITSGTEYFEECSGRYVEGLNADDETKSSFRETIASYRDIYKSEDEDETASMTDTPTYIHLKNAKYFYANANPIPGNMGLLWRGKLAAVDGFSLGTLAAERSN